jgi:malate synthase
MTDGIEILGAYEDRFDEILTPEALAFVADLQRSFNPTRLALLEARTDRQERIDAGQTPDFLPETEDVRWGDWTVAPPPADLEDRRCEITGPTDRKMLINALNSGAKVFMADFEDANSPTWRNMVEGQLNLVDAIRRRIEFINPDGKEYRLNEEVATLMVRPRGWHLSERHVLINGEPVSASLFDFGLYFFHNARELLDRDSGPYFYLPKLESHLEARLWNDVFVRAHELLAIPNGTIKATVLIETILAAFEMDEILYELRDHSAGLNAGRWDYIFSTIKKFRNRVDVTFPDRSQITMSVPFMHAYSELLVATCHRRAAHAMGGMAAFIPSRRDAEVNRVAFAKVREDKERESRAGFDGTWVAHPDLVPVAAEVFTEVLGDAPNQVSRQRGDVSVSAKDLLDFDVEHGAVSDAGVGTNIDVAIQYLASWLRGNGAAAIYNLMEDAATAEISRSQIWQWVRHGVTTTEGSTVDREFVRRIAAEEAARLREEYGADVFATARFPEAQHLFEEVALAEDFPDFLTLPAYDILEPEEDTT